MLHLKISSFADNNTGVIVAEGSIHNMPDNQVGTCRRNTQNEIQNLVLEFSPMKYLASDFKVLNDKTSIFVNNCF